MFGEDKKRLIVTSAEDKQGCSPVFAFMARSLVESLYHIAGYSGSMVVFSDTYQPAFNEDVAPIGEGHPGSWVESVRRKPGVIRRAIDMYPDAEDILWLDSDITATAPLDPIFDWALPGVSAPREGKCRLAGPGFGKSLRPHQMREAVRRNLPGINSGSVLFSGRAEAVSGVDLWSRMMLESRPGILDQMSFNEAVYFGGMNFREWPGGFCSFPVRRTKKVDGAGAPVGGAGKKNGPKFIDPKDLSAILVHFNRGHAGWPARFQRVFTRGLIACQGEPWDVDNTPKRV